MRDADDKKEETETPAITPAAVADASIATGERRVGGMLLMRVKEGESVTDFQARSRKRYAEEGSVFDFAAWLREEARLSTTQMTHPSWEAYKRLTGQREKEISDAD